MAVVTAFVRARGVQGASPLRARREHVDVRRCAALWV
jgi:hypothetical protein